MAEENKIGHQVWFLVGLSVGVLAGILYAPKNGRNTRNDLLNKANDGRDYGHWTGQRVAEQMGDFADKSTSHVAELVDRGTEQVTNYVERGCDALDHSQEQWAEFVGSSKSRVAERASRVTAAANAAKQAYNAAPNDVDAEMH